ncbi:hypothetical protein AVEN_33573-1 [Araneus ventricosus]|uniref:Uncharacterized protein n=1 Tax=Araneus ventricosus TaxID=182803 RepID=A0A4Y2RKR2_ARAVE|nr:hypothetical protein AVEN_33573-1 [Araneus ventricosus]
MLEIESFSARAPYIPKIEFFLKNTFRNFRPFSNFIANPRLEKGWEGHSSRKSLPLLRKGEKKERVFLPGDSFLSDPYGFPTPFGTHSSKNGSGLVKKGKPNRCIVFNVKRQAFLKACPEWE